MQNGRDNSIRHRPSHDSHLQQAQTFFLLKYIYIYTHIYSYMYIYIHRTYTYTLQIHITHTSMCTIHKIHRTWTWGKKHLHVMHHCCRWEHPHDSPLPRVGGSGYELMVQNPLQGTNSQLSMDEIGASGPGAPSVPSVSQIAAPLTHWKSVVQGPVIRCSANNSRGFPCLFETEIW